MHRHMNVKVTEIIPLRLIERLVWRIQYWLFNIPSGTTMFDHDSVRQNIKRFITKVKVRFLVDIGRILTHKLLSVSVFLFYGRVARSVQL
jgi:hypothetical protein